MNYNDVVRFAKRNKVIAFLLSLITLFLIIFLVIFIYSTVFLGASKKHYSLPITTSLPNYLGGEMYDHYPEYYVDDYRGYDAQAGPGLNEIEVKEGSMEIRSEDAESDFRRIEDFVKEEEGYVENSYKTEGVNFVKIYAQIRIPVGNFKSFEEKIMESFDVESFSLTDYRIDVQKQIDDLSIIERAIEDYNVLREKALNLPLGKEQIEMLSTITNEMQYLAKQHREIERELGSKRRQSDLSLFQITITQRVKSDLWPEDLSNTFRDNLSWKIEDITTIFVTIIPNIFLVFIKVIEYTIYLFAIILPIIFTYRLMKNVKTKEKK
jgi:hypothetical protein